RAIDEPVRVAVRVAVMVAVDVELDRAGSARKDEVPMRVVGRVAVNAASVPVAHKRVGAGHRPDTVTPPLRRLRLTTMGVLGSTPGRRRGSQRLSRSAQAARAARRAPGSAATRTELRGRWPGRSRS